MAAARGQRILAAIWAMGALSLVAPPLIAADSDAVGPGRIDAYYPEGEYCDCGSALSAAQAQLNQYGGAEVESVREAMRLLEEIKATRVFSVTIESRHDQPLHGRLTWTGSPWHRMQAVLEKLTYLEAILVPAAPAAVRGLAALRAKVGALITLAREIDPNSGASRWMPVGQVVALIERMHAETQQMVDAAEEVRDRFYCEYALPRELSLLAALKGARATCLPDYCSNESLSRMRRSRTSCWSNDDRGSRDVWDGIADAIVTDVELAGLIPLGESAPFEQVEAAIDHCRQLGVSVVAAPLDPAPDPACGPAAPALTDDTWCLPPSDDDGVQVKRICAEDSQAPFPIPPDCRGRHWGSVRLSGGGSAWGGTYTNGYAAKPNTKENRMGELSIQYDWNAGTGSGDWGQPYIGRGGRIENVTITAEPNGARFSFEYYTTRKGDQDKVINRLADKPRTNSGFFCAY